MSFTRWVRRRFASCWIGGGRRPAFSFLLCRWKETVAAITRITGGNFRLLNRLLMQMERLLEINVLQEVTKAVVEAARESLMIGEA